MEMMEEKNIKLKQISEKQELIEYILELPSKITHPCMVPLSKVGFMPGKIIHTNEFCVCMQNGKKDWMSYVEAANHVRKEIDRLESDMDRGQSNKDSKLALSPKSRQSSQTSTKKSSISVENKGHSKNQPKQVNLSSTTESIAPVFEIREYVDESGKEITSQVVNLNDEFKDTVQSSLLGQADASTLADIFQKLDAKLNIPEPPPSSSSSGGKKTAGVSLEDTPGYQEMALLDEDERFVREIAEIRSQRVSVHQTVPMVSTGPDAAQSILDRFLVLEGEELARGGGQGEGGGELGGDNPSKRQQSRAAASAQTKCKPGWRRGFLAKEGDKSSAPSDCAIASAVVSSQQGGSDSGRGQGQPHAPSIAPVVPRDHVAGAAPNFGHMHMHKVPESTSTSTSKRPMAFTGRVVER